MLFFSKRTHRHQFSSDKEACLSIVGLVLAIGIISGLAVLIYGLIKDHSSSTIGGAIVLGISVFLTVIFILVIVLCPINNNVDSTMNQQQQHHHHQPQSNGQIQHINSSQGLTTVHKYGHTNDSNAQMYSSSIPIELAHSTNSGFGKQLNSPPFNTTTVDFLNQTNSSINNHNRY